MPLAPPAKKTAPEIAITATTLLGVSAATNVNAAIATKPTMIGSLRELIGESPLAITLSVTQPAPMRPTTPGADDWSHFCRGGATEALLAEIAALRDCIGWGRWVR